MNTLINQTLGDLLDEMAEHFPDRPGLDAPGHHFRTTYVDFRDAVNEAAKGLLALGVKKGDHVAILAINYPQWVLAMFATAKIGAVLVTVNTNYKIYEIEYLLRQSDTHTFIMMRSFKDAAYADILLEIVPELKTRGNGPLVAEALPYLKNVVFLDDNPPAGMIPWVEMIEMGKKYSDEVLYAIQKSVDPQDVVNMQYTSGTTGFPKGVMLTHYNILNNGKLIGDNMDFTEEDRLLIHVPLFHCFGCVLGVMAAITHGTSLVLQDYFRPKESLDTVTQEKCTAVHGVPTMFIAMLEHPDFDQYDFSHLRTGIMAGSPCPVEIMRQVADKMNMSEITIVYGLTEASPACTQTNTGDDLEHRVSTVGRAYPVIEVKVVDPDTGEECPVDTPGEFCVRGYNLMKGYYKMPEATAQAIDEDGWLHTGDLATCDVDGYFKIVGRIKDMIIRGGENIYPKELEDFLYTHPAISDVQVVGAPSRQYGEEIAAFIILKQGVAVTADEIKQFVRDHMARHKTPKYIGFVDSFPMNAAGKIQKMILRDMCVKEFGLADEIDHETV